MLARTGLSLLAIVGAFALMVGAAPNAYAQAQNPMVGTWKMNAAKSTSDAALAKKRDLVITQKGDAITVNVDELTADGAANTWSFTTRGDGKPTPATGWAMIDTAVSTLSGRTGKTLYMKNGKQVMESNTDVSADGKTLMITGMRQGPDGKPTRFSTHYDRQ